MILSAEERSEWDDMLTEAWSRSTRAPMVAGDLASMLADAEQAGREWACVILDEALATGLAKMAKAWHGKQALTLKGPVSLTAGVTDGGGYVQLALTDCTPDQLREKLTERESHLKAASRNAKLLRNLLKICAKHPQAATCGAALRAEGTSIDEVLAA